MRKLVQSKASRAFLTMDGGWTTDASIATVFPSMPAAEDAVRRCRITDAQLYYQFGELPSQFDFTISNLNSTRRQSGFSNGTATRPKLSPSNHPFGDHVSHMILANLLPSSRTFSSNHLHGGITFVKRQAPERTKSLIFLLNFPRLAWSCFKNRG